MKNTSEPHAGGPLLKRTEAAKLLNVTPRTLDRLARRGAIPPPFRSGRVVRHNRDALLAAFGGAL